MEHPTQNPTDKQDGKDANRPLHHFLVAAMVLFVANEAAVSVPVNAVILTEDRDLKVAEIAKAQQSAAAQFMQKMAGVMEPTEITIQDIIILGITHLGHYGPVDFQNLPQGAGLADQAAAVVKAAKEGSKSNLKAVPSKGQQ